ncbi:ribosome silencing factor [Paludibacter sp. 221]|uniref:ribosome silencing factor n=1 Tax=Paludibacter sp. 221 TaxID=2302939 RepID=UPI0013D1D74A|nr:ribosome silencing factor [Paludibacter sp. 221]NDV46450.1 ribosome silencing factor [Paludibacter sp. 221]
MVKTEQIVDQIVEGIQERKGKKIVVVDMSELQDAPCSYFVICEGDSRVQVNAISESVKDWLRDNAKVKPYAVDGTDNAEWVAMDYGYIIVHVFLPEVRAFYDIEHLWEDAKLTVIEDLD